MFFYFMFDYNVLTLPNWNYLWIVYRKYCFLCLIKTTPNILQLMGTVILRKRYKLVEYLCVLMITAGLFFLNSSSKSSHHAKNGNETDTTLGFMLISAALMCDALIGNVQEKVFKLYNPSTSENLIYTKFYGMLISLVICAIQGQLVHIFVIIQRPKVMLFLLLFCFSGILGENFIMLTVKNFGM